MKKRFLFGRCLLVAVFLLLTGGALFAQVPEDAVVDTIEVVAAAVGRLLPAAVDARDIGSSDAPITVGIGPITFQGEPAGISEILRSVSQEELLRVAIALHGQRAVSVVQSHVSADLNVSITIATGPTRALFSIQFVDTSGRIRASSRLDIAAPQELVDALAPRQRGVAGTPGMPDDVPDQPEQAREIGVNVTETGLLLDYEGDVDWFTLQVSALSVAEEGALPGLHVFTTGSTDTYLEVYGPDSSSLLIAENDDSGDANAAVSFAVEEGARYWIAVRGFADSATGSYALRVTTREILLDAGEPNNNRATATVLSQTVEPHVASLRPAGDTDWYYLPEQLLQSLPGGLAGNTAGASTVVIRTVSDLDTILRAYDEAGREIAYNDDGAGGGNAQLAIPAGPGLREGLYVEVAGYGDWVEGDYSLVVEAGTITLDLYEPDNSREEARPISFDVSPQRRTFSSESDIDWVVLEVPGRSGDAAVTVTIETYGDIDTFLRLLGPDGREVASSDDDGYGVNARIEIPLSPGTYYLEVTALYLEGGSANEYALEARLR